MEFGDFEIPDSDCVHDGREYPDDISDADFFEALQLADDGSYEPPDVDFGLFEDF